jgi:hypothetical protein
MQIGYVEILRSLLVGKKMIGTKWYSNSINISLIIGGMAGVI